MMTTEFRRAQTIVDQIGDFPTIRNRSFMLSVLIGIENLCRPLHQVFTRSLGQEGWSHLPAQTRDGLVAAYDSLQVTTEVMQEETGIVLPKTVNPPLSGEPLRLYRTGEAATWIAETIATNIDAIGLRVDEHDVALMGLAAVRAFVAWTPAQEAYSDQHEPYYQHLAEGGLHWIGHYVRAA